MDSSTAVQTAVQRHWVKTRLTISGLFIVALGVFYEGIVLPATSFETNVYRYPFSFEANIYLVAVILMAIHFVVRLFIPRQSLGEPVTVTRTIGVEMALKVAFLLEVGGSYLTGTMIATPEIFQPFKFLVGGIVPFALNIHSLFATLLIATGVGIVVLEVARIAVKKLTWKQWLLSARYVEGKALYWVLAVVVIFQGTLGLLLLGSISPIGPFGLFGGYSYNFESLLTHLHGPTAAVLISLFFGMVYLRIRPDYSVR
ncbi:MAG: hypothetical protein JRN06_02260 [Nitrososphaerota archaeon]|nr:hypothetical protein [Nitrososphaerota archaeon]MDG7023321.1 hypothetical protein [Nitrososphaerota archaeon]